jgi:hypothetical protein
VVICRDIWRLVGEHAAIARHALATVADELFRTYQAEAVTGTVALRIRDGGCVFPDCDVQPSWCDAHHVTHWDDGGRTDLDNLCLLCRRHHSITHRRGWSMDAGPAGRFSWTTPTGRTLYAQRHQRRRPPPPGRQAA